LEGRFRAFGAEAKGIIGSVEEVFYIKQGLIRMGGCQVGGIGFCFCAKMCVFPGWEYSPVFEGAIFTLHNYLLIG
jgi:hypothetical protein